MKMKKEQKQPTIYDIFALIGAIDAKLDVVKAGERR